MDGLLTKHTGASCTNAIGTNAGASNIQPGPCQLSSVALADAIDAALSAGRASKFGDAQQLLKDALTGLQADRQKCSSSKLVKVMDVLVQEASDLLQQVRVRFLLGKRGWMYVLAWKLFAQLLEQLTAQELA